MSKAALLARIPVKEGCADDFQAAMDAMFSAVADEEGTELYILSWDRDRTAAYVFEIYSDSEALAAHMGSDAMKALMAAMSGLVDGEPDLTRLAPAAAKGIGL